VVSCSRTLAGMATGGGHGDDTIPTGTGGSCAASKAVLQDMAKNKPGRRRMMLTPLITSPLIPYHCLSLTTAVLVLC
jgi:hypothetical protein